MKRIVLCGIRCAMRTCHFLVAKMLVEYLEDLEEMDISKLCEMYRWEVNSNQMSKAISRILKDVSGRMNKRLLTSALTVERAFYIISRKWRTPLPALEMTPGQADVIVNCICLLHNKL